MEKFLKDIDLSLVIVLILEACQSFHRELYNKNQVSIVIKWCSSSSLDERTSLLTP